MPLSEFLMGMVMALFFFVLGTAFGFFVAKMDTSDDIQEREPT